MHAGCCRTPGLQVYGDEIVHERHRHRYEFNCSEKTLTDNGLRIVGRSLDGKFVEIVGPGHPWFPPSSSTRVQSKPLRPHPLFAGFVEGSTSAICLCKAWRPT